jgi:hypothetical protein
MTITRCLLVGVLLAGCPPPPKAGPRFPPETTLRASGARCGAGKACSCRSLAGGEGQAEEGIAAGHKRFEFRLPRTPSALWVAVEGKGVFYKPPEVLAPTCFYVDLPPGQHRVNLRGEKRDPEVGLQAALELYEHGPKGPFWYRVFDFVCGGNANRCTRAAAQGWIDFQRKLPRGVLDPCSSTMVRGVSVDGVREERLLTDFLDLDLAFTLKLYAFEPYRSPGSPECKAPVKNRPAPSGTSGEE